MFELESTKLMEDLFLLPVIIQVYFLGKIKVDILTSSHNPGRYPYC